VGIFYIDTSDGSVATVHRLIAEGVTVGSDPPPRPWLRIQGSGDATTMWHAVLRKRDRGIWLGTLVMRHGDHHARLLEQGWQEVPLEEIGPVAPSIFSAY
jgi:hypothetical protein